MNKVEYKNWRTVQIAASILYKYYKNVTITQYSSSLFDLIVQDQETGLSFAVKVKNSKFEESNAYQSYIDEILKLQQNDGNAHVPLLLMLVNEVEESARIGFQIAWIHDKVVICKKVSMLSVNQANMLKVLDHIKAMDDTIRILSTYGMKIVKNIELIFNDSNSTPHFAKMVYLRDFTERYKMYNRVVRDERERFERLVNEVPEGDYPEDELDKYIKKAVCEKYPDSQFKSSTMILSTELRDLQQLSKYPFRSKASFVIVPDVNSMDNVVISALSGMSMPSFSLDIFVSSSVGNSYFQDLSFKCRLPVEGLPKKFEDLNNAKKTLHSPTEFFF